MIKQSIKFNIRLRIFSNNYIKCYKTFIMVKLMKQKISWPNNARIAVQIVLNYEEGSESCVLNGDKSSEVFLLRMLTNMLYNSIYY